jgi:hypothetical protein
MSSGSCLTSKLYDKIIKMLSKSNETIPLNRAETTLKQHLFLLLFILHLKLSITNFLQNCKTNIFAKHHIFVVSVTLSNKSILIDSTTKA